MPEESFLDKEQELFQKVKTLKFLSELGVDEAHEANPINRFNKVLKNEKLDSLDNVNNNSAEIAALKKAALKNKTVQFTNKALRLVESVNSVKELRSVLDKFEGFSASTISRKMNFSFGSQSASVMVLCDPPGREEITEKRIYSGEKGVIFGKMFKAIGLCIEENNMYAVPIFPWRLSPNLENVKQDLALVYPFVRKHISLVNPKVLILMTETLEELVGMNDLYSSRQEDLFGLDGTKIFKVAPPGRLIDFVGEKKLAWKTLKEIKMYLGS